MLAQAAIGEPLTETQTVDALRAAIVQHVPSVQSAFEVAASRVYIPGTNKSEWLDFSLDERSISSADGRAIVPSGHDRRDLVASNGTACSALEQAQGHRWSP
jgi:hypothetical protein